jgi:ADP-ribose pyrophosphatase YjhB (NUDIX family)
MAGKYNSMTEYLKDNYKGPFNATDIIIRHNDGHKEGVVLIGRKEFPYGLAFPGGIVEHMKWSDNALKEGGEETGLEKIILDNPEKPLCALSGLDDDPRAFIATLVYTARGDGKLHPDPKEDAKFAMVVTDDELYDLTLEHNARKWAMPRYRHIAQIYLDSIDYHKR